MSPLFVFKLYHVSYFTINPTSRNMVTAEWAGLQPSPQRRLAVRPSALGHHNPTVCSLARRWRIRYPSPPAEKSNGRTLAGEALYYSPIYPNSWSPSSLAWESGMHAGLRPSLMVGPDYTAPRCHTVWDSTIYSNYQSHSSLAWVQGTQPGLWPNLHVG